jgi:hypothetical protein
MASPQIPRHFDELVKSAAFRRLTPSIFSQKNSSSIR